MAERLGIMKTYKLAIGGAFPRSESGRVYPVSAADGRFLANAALASRKDVRDAVLAAARAQPAWSAATPFNRGQILYRVAEVLEGRAAQLTEELVALGDDPVAARSEVAEAVDRWVWYAGWADKHAQVAGSVNPVAGPFFNISVPEPVGVVGVVAPQHSALLGLVSVVAPVLVGGSTVVVIASESRPLPAVTLAEVLATSDLPGGVVNVLTGSTTELAPVLAGHLDIDGLDLTGLAGHDTTELERLAAENVKRVRRAPSGEPDFRPVPRSIARIGDWCDVKTVWHPKGT